MIRWSFVLPRLVIVALVLLAVYLGTNPMVRWTLITTGQATTGAKVDLGWVDTSLVDGRIEIEGIQLANPEQPDRNLVEADRAELNMSVTSFLHRKFVIDEGSLEGIRFGTERMTWGGLPQPSEEARERHEESARKTREMLEPWLKGIQGRLQQAAYEQSETVRVATELLDRWPREYAAVRSEAERIATAIEDVKQQVDEASENPLRNLDRFQQSMEELPRLSRDIDRLYRRLDELSRQLPRDRDAILAAKARDQQKLRELGGIREMDGEALSEIALGEQNGRRVFQVSQWLHWVRAAVPNPEEDFVPERTRGVDLMFGKDRQPDILIRKLALSGVGRMDGERYEVSGWLTGVTTQPKLYGQPARLKLIAEGPKRILVTAELDRSQGAPIDRFRVLVPRIENGAQAVGDPSSIQLAVDGGQTAMECQLVLRDEELVGVLKTKHEDVHVDIAALDDSLGGSDVQQLLSSSLQEIDQFDVTIYLSGTLRKPQFRLKSDLGPRVAQRFRASLQGELDRRVAQSLEKLDTVAEEKIALLEKRFEQASGGAVADLQIGQRQLEQLRTEVARRLSFGRIR